LSGSNSTGKPSPAAIIQEHGFDATSTLGAFTVSSTRSATSALVGRALEMQFFSLI
jgi:hypothetical protein